MNKITSQKRMRHSKFKNTGILFELLTKQVTADIIAGKDSCSATHILREFFNYNTEIGKEWQLYNKILNEKVKTDTYAERYYSTVLEARKKLDGKLLLSEKYELIKAIKKSYPLDEMLKSPVKNYKVLASIYKLFENVTSTIKFEVDEIYHSKNVIVEHLTNKTTIIKEDEQTLNTYKAQSEDIRLLTYKLLVEKLNEKYSSILDNEQKNILKEYICSVANTNQFDVFVKKHISKIKSDLCETINKITDSDVTKIKLKEIIHQLDKINETKIVKDNHITVLMLSYELIKEIKEKLNKSELIK